MKGFIEVYKLDKNYEERICEICKTKSSAGAVFYFKKEITTFSSNLTVCVKCLEISNREK